jgi:hypothetical protein
MRTRTFFITCLFCLAFIPTSEAQNAKKAWAKVLKSCGSSQIVGKEVIFFGPSNTIGLGSVWRKVNRGGYNPRFELADLVPDPAARQEIIKLGQKSERCEAGKSTNWNVGASLPFVGPIFGMTGIEADLRKARRATVTAENLALDVIKEVQFESAIRSLAATDPNNRFLKDLLGNEERLLVTKAYRITGLIVKLDYDPKLLENLKEKYPNGASIKLGGEKGVEASFNYGSESSLTLKLPQEVYIAGEFSRITDQGTINLNDPSQLGIQLIPVKVDTNAVAGPIEEPQ